MSPFAGLRRPFVVVALTGALALAGAAGPAAAAAPASLAPADSGGVLYVSGLRTELHPSWDPRGGRLHLEMTVRNATAEPLDASVSYGARTLAGVDLGAGDNLAVRGLAPGEVRTIEVDVEGVGQWGLLEAHMTVSPPSDVLGVQVTALDRERWVFSPPWYLMGFLVLVVGLVVLLRRHPLRRGLLRRRRRAPRGARTPVPAVAR